MTLGISLTMSSAVHSADLATIRARGHLVVGVKDDWRPLSFTDDTGNLVGFEIDIATRLAELLFGDAEAVVLRPMSNQERIAAVLKDEVDLAIAGLSMTPMRERILDFSYPYYLDGTGFITNNFRILTLKDLRNQKIAVIEGSSAIPSIRYILPSARLVGVSSYQAALVQAEARQVTAVAADITVLAGWLQEHPDYRFLPSFLTAEPLAVAMPKGNQYKDLRQFVNHAIVQWHDEGWLEQQADLWGLP